MWTVGEMKRKGWENVKKYFWSAFFVVLITSILGGEGAGFSVNNSTRDRDSARDVIEDTFEPEIVEVPEIAGVPEAAGESEESDMPGILSGYMLTFTSIFIFVFVFMFVIIIVLRTFVGNPMTVGQMRFFMESRAMKRSAGFSKAFWAFGCGHYLNVVKIMFLRDLYTFLWFLLLVIPGIIKSYEYSMIPYILSENPETASGDVFALTKDMTQDQKFHLFVLDLSFIGWLILGALLCGVGVYFVMPYIMATAAEVYTALKKNIDGFPFGGFGVTEEPDIYQQIYDI